MVTGPRSTRAFANYHDYVQGVIKKDIDSSQIPYSVVTSDPDHPSIDLLGQVMDNWGGPWSFAQLPPSQTGSYR